MSSENETVIYSPTESSAPVVDVPDVETVSASDTSGAKNTRNVQTQHGDYRSVDAENIFLIPRCLWPEVKLSYMERQQSTSQATTSDKPSEDEVEQVVWIEPFADEVSFLLFNIFSHFQYL